MVGLGWYEKLICLFLLGIKCPHICKMIPNDDKDTPWLQGK